MLKTCSICKEEKPVSEFRKDRAKKDGLHQRCKMCHSGYNARRYLKDKKKIQEKRKGYLKAYQKNRSSDPEYKKMRRAGAAVRQKISSGKIKRGLYCAECGSDKNIQGHHPDYNKPLEVVWMCASCHAKLHWAERK